MKSPSSVMMKKGALYDILEEDRITLKMNINSLYKPAARAKILLSQIDPSHTSTNAAMDCNRPAGRYTDLSTSTCANVNLCRVSSRNQTTDTRSANFGPLQRMFNMTKKVPEGTGQSIAKESSNVIVNRFVKRSKASYISEGLLRPSFICLVITMTLTSCFLVAHASENGPESADVVKANQGHDNNKQQQLSDRISDSPADKPETRLSSPSSPSSPSSSPSSSSSSDKSIVASLSSAVASAAAAAALAAAQNSLSSSDARSLVSGPHHRHHSQPHHRPHGLNLAIKLVDTIPEVPYNILHNMKKLDHAAPFYNVPNKLAGSNTKESSQNFFSNALANSGNFGGAAEQLSALFRSPLWKRIADGYGEFTSEFRSRFRAPGAAPMKGPTSSTSKLLRDISVPALLMLIASSVSGADWRPVRTRRKSFVPVDIPATTLSSSSAVNPLSPPPQYYQLGQQQQQSKTNMDPIIPESSSGNSWIDQAAVSRLQDGQPPMQQAEPNQLVRFNDINLQPAASMDGIAANAWMSSQVSGATQPLSMRNGGQDQHQQYQSYQPAVAAAFPQQQVVRRSDEFIATDGHSSYASSASKSTEPQKRANLFSSLTSDLALGQTKLMSKLLNANVAGDGNAHRMMSLADSFGRMSPVKRDQLSDKQRYSLVEPNSGESMSSLSEARVNEHKLSSSSSTKPLLLSAMANAVSSIISPQLWRESGSSSSLSSGLASRASFLSRSGLQQQIGDKTINQSDMLMRRQPHFVDSVAEQRDLTKLLPESWREVVKRTMSTVQQQANVQWKSIEGQLTNWVQDKLKTVATGASVAPASSSSSSGGSNAHVAPMTNMLASMSSTALNILGLHKNANSSLHSHSVLGEHHASSTAKVEKSATGGASDLSSASQRGKLEKKSPTTQQPSRSALANVVSVPVKLLMNRQSSSTTTTISSPMSPPSKSPALTGVANSDPLLKQQSQAADDLPVSASGGVATKYSTQAGSQSQETEKSANLSNGAAATMSSQANLHNATY